MKRLKPTILKYKLDQINYNTYKLSYNFDKEKKYVLFLKDSVFLSYQGNKNKGLNYNINFYRDEDVGTLKIKSNYVLFRFFPLKIINN